MTDKFKASVTTKTVETIIFEVSSKENTIDINPSYQREVVWNEKKQSEFILSILEGIIPNALIFNRDENNKKICIDGKQRITSLCRYKTNKFPIFLDNKYVYYSTIPNNDERDNISIVLQKREQSIFNGREMNIIEYKNLKFEEQIDVFNRIQNGKKLTKNEILASCFNSEEVCILFKEFCKQPSIIEKLSKFCGDDKKHPTLIAKLLYILDKDELKILKNTESKKYLKDLRDVGRFGLLLNKLSQIINFYFCDNILHNKNYNLKYQDESLIIFYHLNKMYGEDILEETNKLLIDKIRKAVSIIYIDLNNVSTKNKNKINSIKEKLELYLLSEENDEDDYHSIESLSDASESENIVVTKIELPNKKTKVVSKLEFPLEKINIKPVIKKNQKVVAKNIQENSSEEFSSSSEDEIIIKKPIKKIQKK